MVVTFLLPKVGDGRMVEAGGPAAAASVPVMEKRKRRRKKLKTRWTLCMIGELL
jgi:hypothetical protein